MRHLATTHAGLPRSFPFIFIHHYSEAHSLSLSSLSRQSLWIAGAVVNKTQPTIKGDYVLALTRPLKPTRHAPTATSEAHSLSLSPLSCQSLWIAGAVVNKTQLTIKGDYVLALLSPSNPHAAFWCHCKSASRLLQQGRSDHYSRINLYHVLEIL